jgi:hypothetical protein
LIKRGNHEEHKGHEEKKTDMVFSFVSIVFFVVKGICP